MADALQNAQYALGLFQPLVNSVQRNDAQNLSFQEMLAERRRQDAILFWKREQEKADLEAKANLERELTAAHIQSARDSSKEQTDRIIQEFKLQDQRARAAEVRKLYENYATLTDEDKRRPLADFGSDVDAQFQELSKTVGDLKSRTQMDQGIRKLYEDYGALGGKNPLESFGKTDASQIQGLSQAVGDLRKKQAKDAYVALGRQLSDQDTKIAEAEKLSPDEDEQAKYSGLQVLSPKARAIYDRSIAAGFSHDKAMEQVRKSFPADVGAYSAEVNKVRIGLRIQKRDSDKVLRELYNNRSDLSVLKSKAAMRLMDEDPSALMSPDSPLAQAPSIRPGSVSAQDAIKTTLGSRSKAAEPQQPSGDTSADGYPNIPSYGPPPQPLNFSGVSTESPVSQAPVPSALQAPGGINFGPFASAPNPLSYIPSMPASLRIGLSDVPNPLAQDNLFSPARAIRSQYDQLNQHMLDVAASQPRPSPSVSNDADLLAQMRAQALYRQLLSPSYSPPDFSGVSTEQP